MTACPREIWKWKKNKEVSTWQRVHEEYSNDKKKTTFPREIWKWKKNNEVSIRQRVHENRVMLVGYSEIIGKPAGSLKYEGFWVRSSIKKILLLFTTRIKCNSVA
jgi:hypothetical protein